MAKETTSRGKKASAGKRKDQAAEEGQPYGLDRQLSSEARAKRNAERTGRFHRQAIEFRDRLLFILDAWAPEKQKYDYLDSRTGIAATRWLELFNEEQMPTVDMILAVCEHDRSQAHWLLTGLDPESKEHDHLKPTGPGGWAGTITASWDQYRALREAARRSRTERKVCRSGQPI